MASFSAPKNKADNKDDAPETLSAIDANASTRQSESSSSDGSTSSSSDEDEIDELTQRRGTKLNAFLTDVNFGSHDYGSEEMVDISLTIQYDWAEYQEGDVQSRGS